VEIAQAGVRIAPDQFASRNDPLHTYVLRALNGIHGNRAYAIVISSGLVLASCTLVSEWYASAVWSEAPTPRDSPRALQS
jgi:hypothetical protein